ncbi:MAG: hypothetical protein R3C01_11040 [Planctomycetaceae bacterium]
MTYMAYLVPITAAVSLVYSATRYEQTERIVRNALDLFLRILIFMVIALGLLWLLSP